MKLAEKCRFTKDPESYGCIFDRDCTRDFDTYMVFLFENLYSLNPWPKWIKRQIYNDFHRMADVLERNPHNWKEEYIIEKYCVNGIPRHVLNYIEICNGDDIHQIIEKYGIRILEPITDEQFMREVEP
jgi:hypothetical protein